mgnify:CR=1 FL=1
MRSYEVLNDPTHSQDLIIWKSSRKEHTAMKLKMSPSLFLRKLLILVLGLFVLAFGISLSSSTNLGVSPSQSLSYVLSLVFHGKLGIEFLSWGVCTTILNFLFFGGQILILKKDFKPIYCLQMVVVFVFSFFTDWTKALVSLMPIGSQPYIIRLIIQIISCAIIALGIFLEVKAELIVMASEGFITALSKVIKKDFGMTKIFIDWGCIAISAVISLLVFGMFNGVREGTLIAAFLDGAFVRIYNKRIKFLDSFVGTEQVVVPETYYGSASYPLVITIDREIGAGGQIIAKALSEKLGIKLYDYELIEETAKKAGLPYENVKRSDERLGNSLLARYSQDQYSQSIVESQADEIFHAQAKVIRDITSKESCIILGRLGSYILKNRPNTMKLFFSADVDYRAKIMAEHLSIPFDEALKLVKQEDSLRVNYCRHFTGTGWGIACHYGMTLHTSDYGLDNSVKLVLDAMETATCRYEETEPEQTKA